MTEASLGREMPPVRDWTKGSIVRNLTSLSLPMVVHEGFYMLGQTVDMIWIGRLGTASIAGVGISATVAWLAESAMLMGLVVGMTAMITRFVGSGDVPGAVKVAWQAFIISAVFGVIVTVVGVLFAESILQLFGLEADVVAEGTAYMQTLFAGWIATSLWLVSLSIMRASGDAVTPMKISIFARCIHLVLSPMLIFGWWVIPDLGVRGAALSNIAAQVIGMSLAFWVLLSGRTRLRLSLGDLRVDFNTIWRIMRIGIPSAITGMQTALGNLVFARFMVPFGTIAVAAHSLFMRVLMVLIVPTWAIGAGAGVLVGQNLGAAQPGRAEKTGWQAIGLAAVIVVTASVAILLWAEGIIGVFTADSDLVETASAFLRIATAGYLMTAIVIVLQQAISGAGDTLPAMIFSMVTVWAVQLPLAYLLPRITDLGVYGVRWALVAGPLVGAVAYSVYFRSGRWKRKGV